MTYKLRTRQKIQSDVILQCSQSDAILQSIESNSVQNLGDVLDYLTYLP